MVRCLPMTKGPSAVNFTLHTVTLWKLFYVLPKQDTRSFTISLPYWLIWKIPWSLCFLEIMEILTGPCSNICSITLSDLSSSGKWTICSSKNPCRVIWMLESFASDSVVYARNPWFFIRSKYWGTINWVSDSGTTSTLKLSLSILKSDCFYILKKKINYIKTQ